MLTTVCPAPLSSRSARVMKVGSAGFTMSKISSCPAATTCTLSSRVRAPPPSSWLCSCKFIRQVRDAERKHKHIRRKMRQTGRTLNAPRSEICVIIALFNFCCRRLSRGHRRINLQYAHPGARTDMDTKTWCSAVRHHDIAVRCDAHYLVRPTLLSTKILRNATLFKADVGAQQCTYRCRVGRRIQEEIAFCG